MIKKRSEVEERDRWSVENLFPNLEMWEAAFQKITAGKIESKWWPKLTKYRGRLKESSKVLCALLQEFFAIKRGLVKLYTYACLRHDEDLVCAPYRNILDRISLLYADFQNETSWIQPEILNLPQATLEHYLEDDTLKHYAIYLQKISVLRPHILPADMEHLFSLAEKALETPRKAFSILNDADLEFGTVKDGQGSRRELTHGTYALYLRAQDPILRKNAALQLHRKYGKFENSIAVLIEGQVKRHVFEAKARHHPSCLHAALTPNQIPVNIYHNLIQTVQDNLPALHRYIELRKRLSGVEQIHAYDLHTSPVPDCDMRYSFEEAKDMVLTSLSPLGDVYCHTLKKGLEEERWVDRFENEKKRSGAYSGGCYDSFPYILMNFQGTFHDVRVLAHEVGHSMHSYYSNHAQPFEYSHYPIFVAEVASTLNEMLLFHMLLQNAKSKKEQCYLLHQQIDDIRSTFFRQVQFAEFELQIHTMAENGEPLTAQSLMAKYQKLNEKYYGPALHIDSEMNLEYLRVPHFYLNFYVYQYATGISAAHALFHRLISGEKGALKDYLQFLSAGSSRYPVDLLKDAGVDIDGPSPIRALIDHFSSLVRALENKLGDFQTAQKE